MVPQHPKIKNVFRQIISNFHGVLVNPHSCRMVRFTLTFIRVYGVIGLFNAMGLHQQGYCVLSQSIPAYPG